MYKTCIVILKLECFTAPFKEPAILPFEYFLFYDK